MVDLIHQKYSESHRLGVFIYLLLSLVLCVVKYFWSWSDWYGHTIRSMGIVLLAPLSYAGSRTPRLLVRGPKPFLVLSSPGCFRVRSLNLPI